MSGMQKSGTFLTYKNGKFDIIAGKKGTVMGKEITKACVVIVKTADQKDLIETLNGTLGYIAELFTIDNIQKEIIEYGKKDIREKLSKVTELIGKLKEHQIKEIKNISDLYAEAENLKKASKDICHNVKPFENNDVYIDELRKRIFQYNEVHKKKIYNSKIYLYGDVAGDKKYMVIDVKPEQIKTLSSTQSEQGSLSSICTPTTSEKELAASKVEAVVTETDKKKVKVGWTAGKMQWVDCRRDAYYYTPKKIKCQLFHDGNYTLCTIIGLEFRDDPNKLLPKDPRIIIQINDNNGKIVDIDQICIVSNSQPGGSYTNPSVQSINEYNNNDTNKYNKAYMKYKQQYLDTKYSY